MAQLHTYLVSRLPRKSDRDRISEAFMLSEAEFAQTYTFDVGEWLLVSDGATGLKGVPTPIKAENANKRIKKFLGLN